jgi:hypothetical protein
MNIEDKLLISIEEDYKSLVLGLKRLEEALYRDFINNSNISLYDECRIIVDKLKSYLYTCNFFVNEIANKNKSLLSAYYEVVENNKILKKAIELAEINQRAYKELYEKMLSDVIEDNIMYEKIVKDRLKNDEL